MDRSLLSREDFSNALYRNFKCPSCDKESTYITRHSEKREYVATFECSNSICIQNAWHKCRACRDDKVLGSRTKSHVALKKHKKAVAEFEQEKGTAYTEMEKSFLNGPLLNRPDVDSQQAENDGMSDAPGDEGDDVD